MTAIAVTSFLETSGATSTSWVCAPGTTPEVLSPR